MSVCQCDAHTLRDLRDHSKPCATCGRYSPEVDHGYLEPQATCSECCGAGGRAVTIDYEAAGRRLEPLLSWPDDDVAAFVKFALMEARAIIAAAAIGDTG